MTRRTPAPPAITLRRRNRAKPMDSVRGSTPDPPRMLRTAPHPATTRAGYTLVEMLLALVIAAVLGVAIAAATSASFHAYGTSMSEATMQNSGRMVMQRVMSLIRTSTLHDAHDPDNASVSLLPPASSAHPLRTVGIRFQTPEGQVHQIWWQPNDAYDGERVGDVMIAVDGGDPETLIGRATAQQTGGDEPYIFTLASRDAPQGLVLIRATLDLQLEPDPAGAMPIEEAVGRTDALRLVASTVPRKNMN